MAGPVNDQERDPTMCKSTAEGGQRCIGHATAKMVGAQDRYEKALGYAQATEAKGGPGHAQFVRKATAAFEKFDAARIEYASTPQGEADLKNRLRAALNGTAADTGVRTPDGKPLDNPVDLETAIVMGRMTRKRNEQRRARNAATSHTARRRTAAAPSTYTPGATGEIVRLTQGTPDNLGLAYLPEGAHVRFRDTITNTRGERVLLVERVRLPGDKGEDELDMGYGRSHNGTSYQIPLDTVGPTEPGDTTAEYFTENPTASGDDYTGDEDLDSDEDLEEDDYFWNEGH